MVASHHLGSHGAVLAGTDSGLPSSRRGPMGECTQRCCFPSAPPEEQENAFMPQPHVAAATVDPQSYLRQAEVDGRRLRDVHDFTVRRHNKDEAVQRLKDQRGPLDRSHDLSMNSLLTLPPSSRSRSIFMTLTSCLEFLINYFSSKTFMKERDRSAGHSGNVGRGGGLKPVRSN